MTRSAGAALARDISAPTFAVSVGGTPLPVALASQVNRICVDEDVGLPSMFALELAAGDATRETSFIDGGQFAVGTEVEVKFGYGNALQTLMAGEITSIETEFKRGTAPSLVVRGHDRRHRLLRGRKTRSFVQQKDSDIAVILGGEAGLDVKAEDSQVRHEYVLQANQNNLEFLQERARHIAYEIVIEAQTLHFRPLQSFQAEVLTLTFEDDLLEFSPRLSAMGQLTEVEVRGWSPKDKQEIVANARAGDEVSTMGGQQSGAVLAQRAFSDAICTLSDRPVASQAEADQRARAYFNRAVLGLVCAEGSCSGRADLRPGQVIKVDGIGTRFSGQYYVTATQHRYCPRRAYETRFVVRRNAA